MTLSLQLVTPHVDINPPEDAIDSELYQYAVATDAEKFFKRERARTLDIILSNHDEAFNQVEEATQNSITTNSPAQLTLLTGMVFDFELNISRPYARFNREILKQLLLKETNLSAADVNRLFKLSTEIGTPRKTFKTVER